MLNYSSKTVNHELEAQNLHNLPGILLKTGWSYLSPSLSHVTPGLAYLKPAVTCITPSLHYVNYAASHLNQVTSALNYWAPSVKAPNYEQITSTLNYAADHLNNVSSGLGYLTTACALVYGQTPDLINPAWRSITASYNYTARTLGTLNVRNQCLNFATFHWSLRAQLWSWTLVPYTSSVRALSVGYQAVDLRYRELLFSLVRARRLTANYWTSALRVAQGDTVYHLGFYEPGWRPRIGSFAVDAPFSAAFWVSGGF